MALKSVTQRWIAIIGAFLLLLLGLAGLKGQEIKYWAEQQLTANMFVASDTDAFDPGLKVGERFPLLEARLNQTIVNSIDPLIADKGLIFIASRSVDW